MSADTFAGCVGVYVAQAYGDLPADQESPLAADRHVSATQAYRQEMLIVVGSREIAA